jgi:hypothetical protein
VAVGPGIHGIDSRRAHVYVSRGKRGNRG